MRRLDLATMTEFLADPQNGGTLAHYFREGEDRTVALAVADAVLDRPPAWPAPPWQPCCNSSGPGKTRKPPFALPSTAKHFLSPPDAGLPNQSTN